MRIYGLKSCDTCRKALKTLDGAEFIDIRATPMEAQLLAALYEQFGAALVNTRSTTWRGLSEKERQTPALDLLAAHPALMKRPVIEHNGAFFLGWTDATRQALAAPETRR